MRSFSIPSSIEDAVTELKGVGELLTAKEWQRAAIVFAFTRDGVRGPGATETLRTEGLSIPEFSALGISGLKSDQTVRKYRKAWATAIEDGHATEVRPGDVAQLPDVEWPPTANDHGRADKIKGDSSPQDKAEVIATLLDDPDVLDVLVSDLDMADRIEAALARSVPTSSTSPSTRTPKPVDLIADLRSLHRTIQRVAEAATSGEAVVNEEMASALVDEVRWLKNALDMIESGLTAGSLESALSRLLEEGAR